MSFQDNDRLKEMDATAAASTAAVSAEDIQSSVDDVMKKFDRESNVRLWEGTPKIIVNALLVAFSCFCIYVTL